jgi:phosphonopyruvate decarboxylase
MSEGMTRADAVAALAELRGDMLSVVTMQAMAPWNRLGQADARNFNVVASMGSAAAVGLGLALARPDERVLVIDGDGSLLMQLGSLVSVASLGVANFYHVVMENGTYETSGGQPVPGRQVADLAEIARASGYRHALRLDSVADLRAKMPGWLRFDGPVFVGLRISGPGELPAGAATRVRIADKPAQIENMRLALAASRA